MSSHVVLRVIFFGAFRTYGATLFKVCSSPLARSQVTPMHIHNLKLKSMSGVLSCSRYLFLKGLCSCTTAAAARTARKDVRRRGERYYGASRLVVPRCLCLCRKQSRGRIAELQLLQRYGRKRSTSAAVTSLYVSHISCTCRTWFHTKKAVPCAASAVSLI